MWNDALSLLRDQEGNHCTSFPVPLLRILQKSKTLMQDLHESSPQSEFHQEEAHRLVEAAHLFDPYTWAADLRHSCPPAELQRRISIACAHRAATCIFVRRTLTVSQTPTEGLASIDDLAADGEAHLSSIAPGDTLLSATAWPTFIFGAEARSYQARVWARKRLQSIWDVQPWGVVKGALALLEVIWNRPSARGEVADDGDWMSFMHKERLHWLVI